jgi:hypothetical protein
MQTKPLTDRQRRILAAIEKGHTGLRAICNAANVSSTSVVKNNLERLAADGHLILRRTTRGAAIYTGRDYAAGWNAAARLAGNDEA